MSNIVQLPVITTLDLDPDIVLENLQGKLSSFVLCGYDKDGEEFFSTTKSDGGECLWLMERFKLQLLRKCDPY